jgi:hypothetical protein
VGAALLTGLVLLAGCGPGSSTQVSGAASLANYRSCLQQHGVIFPTGTPTPGEPRPIHDRATVKAFKKARKTCAPLRPPGSALRPYGLRAQNRQSFARCMADHGVPLPAPTEQASPPPGELQPSDSPTAPRGGLLAGLDRNDPTTKAALEACRSHLTVPTIAPAAAPSGTPAP